MGLYGDRDKLEEGRPEQKWSYINLSDFKSHSCGSPFSYGILYIALIISIAVYLVDIFTAANLLFFDRWSGQVQPVIPFTYSRWIFAGCIILSFILLVYRWMRAIRVIRGGVVAASYLDPLAVRVQSVRRGNEGRGWRRFLVFAALTKGRKGAEYVALFTYFSFEAWMRIVFAEGPRQIINALTLWTVMQANLVPTGQHAATGKNSSIGQFFVNVQILAASNREQAVILFGMLFTLIIWLISALSLLLATLFYVFFLWHHIPSSDGSLSRYCRRKIDKRLSQIVGVKINKAIERENKQRFKGEANGDGASLRHQPTLPMISDDKAGFSRHTSQSSSPTDSQTTYDDARRPSALPGSDRPTPPSRNVSQMSTQSGDSYSSNAPLMVAANGMGHDGAGRPYSPVPTSAMTSERTYQPSKPGLYRIQTQDSQRSYRSHENAWSGRIAESPNQIPLGPYSATSPTGTEVPGRFAALSSRNATPASFRPQPQGRKPLPRNMPGERNSYEMQRPNTATRVTSPTSFDYTAYNPAMHAHQNGFGDLYISRTATAPPERLSSRQYGNQYFGQEALQPQRSGTAPIGHGRTSTSAAWAAQKGVMDRY